MANFKEIRRSVRRAASKVVSKTGDLTDTASLHVKLAQKEANLSDLYEQFGRVAYQKLKTGEGADEKSRVLIEKIDVVRAEIYAINKAIKEKKEAREAEKIAAQEAEEAVERAEREAKQHHDED